MKFLHIVVKISYPSAQVLCYRTVVTVALQFKYHGISSEHFLRQFKNFSCNVLKQLILSI